MAMAEKGRVDLFTLRSCLGQTLSLHQEVVRAVLSYHVYVREPSENSMCIPGQRTMEPVLSIQ